MIGPMGRSLGPLGYVPPTNGDTLLTSLSAHYKADEASGDLLDAHTGGLHLIAQNAPLSTSGKILTARQLVRASSQHFRRATSAPFEAGSTPITLSCWAKLDSLSNDGQIFYKGTATNTTSLEYRLFFLSSTNRIRLQVAGNGINSILDANNFGALSTGVWYHILGWWDPVVGMGLRINGGTANTLGRLVALNVTSADFSIGGTSSGVSTFGGSVDEISVWRRYLPDTAQLSVYNSGSGLPYSQYGLTGV